MDRRRRLGRRGFRPREDISAAEHRRLESGLPLRYPERVLLGVTAGGYVLINLALVARAAWG
jgi:hypothetical protein